MDSFLAYYVTYYYGRLMTRAERLAYRHLCFTFKSSEGRSDVSAQEALRAQGSYTDRLLTDDPEALRLAADGLEAFRARVAARILEEHGSEVFLNYCPKCGELTRTPKARFCAHCGHDWHSVEAP